MGGTRRQCHLIAGRSCQGIPPPSHLRMPNWPCCFEPNRPVALTIHWVTEILTLFLFAPDLLSGKNKSFSSCAVLLNSCHVLARSRAEEPCAQRQPRRLRHRTSSPSVGESAPCPP